MKKTSPNLVLVDDGSKHTRGGGTGTGGGDMDERFRKIETAIDCINATMERLSNRVDSMSETLARIDERTKYLEVRFNDAPTKAWFYSTIVPVYFGLFAAILGGLKWLLTPAMIAALIERLSQ